MAMRRNYKCERCGKEYTYKEFERLPEVIINPEDPQQKFIKRKVCECGYRFGIDGWKKEEEVLIPESRITVVAKFTELNYGTDERPLWYSVEVIPNRWDIDHLEWHFETKEDALKAFERAVTLLRNGKYKILPHGYYLELGDKTDCSILI